MTALENVVRPFETKPIRPGNLTTGRTNPTTEYVELNCGSPDGSATTLQASASASITAYTDGASRETTREVTPVRITNEDDPSQHVDVEVTTKMTTVDTVPTPGGDVTTRKETKFSDVLEADNAVVTGPSKKLDAELKENRGKKDSDKPKDGW